MKSPILRWLLLSLILAAPAAQAAEARQIKVIAAASPAFKQNPDWQKDITERIGHANKVFEKEYGLHFRVEQFKAWDAPDENKGMPVLVEDLKKFPVGPGQIVIGFHKMTKAGDSEKMEDMETVGTASFFLGRIAIRDPYGDWTPAQRQTVMVHEIAHLFGAVHVSASSAIMYPSLPAMPEEKIDPENRQIISLTNSVDFQKGLDSFSAKTLDDLISIYEKLIRLNPQSDFYHQLGLFYRKRNLEARAIAVWEEALRHHYSNPAIHYELGVYYHKAGNYDRAVQELGSAIAHFVLESQKKQKAGTLNLLGAAYFEKGMNDQAVYTWLQGLTLDPDNAGLQSNLAAAFLQKGELDRAFSELEKLHAKYPDDAVVISNLGTLAMRKKEYAKAVDYFTQAIAKSSAPQDAEKSGRLLTPIPEWALRFDLGSAYAEMKDYERAGQEMEKAKIRKPDDNDLRRELGRVYVLKKEYRKAITELDEAVRLNPKDSSAYALTAQAQAESGNTSQAVSAAKQAIRYSDNKDFEAMMHRNVGLIYAKDGNTIKALEELKLSVSLNWKDAEAHYNLGVTYAHQNDWANAKRSFQTALSINPGMQPAKDALASLKDK